MDLVPWLLGAGETQHQPVLIAALHAGSCAGVAWALRRQLGALTGREFGVLALSSVPAAIAGLVVTDRFEHLWADRRVTAGLLATSGGVLLLADRRRTDRPVDDTSAATAAIAQLVALAPGVSRSGATLTALRLRHTPRAAAQDFALLMSLPVTSGAAALRLLRADRVALRTLAPALATGVPIAAVTAAATTAAVRRHGGAP
ncbi:MAG: undecaprenyl-diphosphate phosphatase, partial [Mycobacteriales bacterium]